MVLISAIHESYIHTSTYKYEYSDSMTKNTKTIQIERDIVRHVETMAYGQALGTLTKLVERFNPTLKSILKVEELFREKIEFDSKNQLLREMNNSMKASVLNVILVNLVIDNKITINDDNSLTWIYAEDNAKLKKSWAKAKPL